MEKDSRLHKTAEKVWLWRMVGCAVIALAFVSTAIAAPVTYTGFTITSGQLGSWQFTNARVYLRFNGDTNNVQLVPPNLSGPADVLINTVGRATVTIITDTRRVRATFAPNQVFVSLDLGDPLDLPHIGGRGIGFGSFTPTGGFEPAYPLGIEDGTIDWGDALNPSPALPGLSTDLAHDTAFSGRAWICVGFPTFENPCSAPNPLKTNKGDLLLFQPYQQLFPGNPTAFGNTLSGGFFFAVVGNELDLDDDD